MYILILNNGGLIQVIEINSIKKTYGKNCVLKDICLTVHAGDCIGIVGANGSGKTTLLSIISGIYKADSGNISIEGKNITFSSKTVRNYISYVPQENPLIEELSGLDNLRLWYRGNRKELDKELKDGILHTLGIDNYCNKAVSKMSGGMKKRLSIGIALLEKPSLLIMDEPSAALDISGKYEIKEYMKYYTTKLNGSIIVASHDQNELSVCNRLYLLKEGLLQPISSDMTEDELIKIL